MDKAVTAWLAHTAFPDPDASALAAKLRTSRYTRYDRMLLLPSTTPLPPSSELPLLCTHLATHLHVTHIAISRPIPALSSSPSSSSPSSSSPSQPNIIRAPSAFEPIHGDFGPTTLLPPLSASSSSPSLPTSSSSYPPTPQPSPLDFAAAFWVHAKQHGLLQVWAPRWTMFSRGNAVEKARLLTLPSVRRAVADGTGDLRGGSGVTALDLYVGIGYFAFPYLRAGVRCVLGWELNGWSLEGLRRGAEGNGWGVRIVGAVEEGIEAGDADEGKEQEEEGRLPRLVAFHESNARALGRLERWRDRLPPVRHVNCGLLPSSRESWGIAVRGLDAGWEGWVHVHENFAVGEIAARAEEVRVAFEGLVRARREEEEEAREGEEVAVGWEGEVRIEEIHRVKSYAPGVMHCVLDIRVPALSTRSAAEVS